MLVKGATDDCPRASVAGMKIMDKLVIWIHESKYSHVKARTQRMCSIRLFLTTIMETLFFKHKGKQTIRYWLYSFRLMIRHQECLTHWGWVTHLFADKLNIIGSDNGLLPGRRQAIICTNAGRLLIGPLRTNLSQILIGIRTFSFKQCTWKCFLRTSVHFVLAGIR